MDVYRYYFGVKTFSLTVIIHTALRWFRLNGFLFCTTHHEKSKKMNQKKRVRVRKGRKQKTSKKVQDFCCRGGRVMCKFKLFNHTSYI